MYRTASEWHALNHANRRLEGRRRRRRLRQVLRVIRCNAEDWLWWWVA